jgi:hypothetical protein
MLQKLFLKVNKNLITFIQLNCILNFNISVKLKYIFIYYILFIEIRNLIGKIIELMYVLII